MYTWTLLLAGFASALPSSLQLRSSMLSTRDVACSTGVHIIVARGTFEAQKYGGLGLMTEAVDAVIKAIPGSNASAVVYPASALKLNTSISTGVSNAQEQITDYYTACPKNKIVLMGYSQGAQIIGNAISGGGTLEPTLKPSGPAEPISQDIGKNVVAVVLFGDPNRVKGQGIDSANTTCEVSATSPRNGTNHEAMAFYADRLDEYCAPHDPVCCGAGKDILDHLSYWTPATSKAVAAYVSKKFTAASAA